MSDSKLDLPLLDEVISDIQRVLDETGLSPLDLTVDKYNKAGGKFDGRNLRRIGGFNSILTAAFKDRDVTTSRFVQKQKRYTSKLETQIADQELFKRSLLDGFKTIFTKMSPINLADRVEKIKMPKSVVKDRANGVLISDTHLGLEIDPEEVMTNGYNWVIGARRLGKLAEQVAKYKLDHREECEELHVCLGGDLGQGAIHLDDNNTDLVVYQVNGITQYMVQMIDYWRHFYKRIYVHCTPDNHLRMPHKGPHRNTAQKFDAFSTMIHMGIQLSFRNADDVIFNVPKQAITTFHVLNHKFGLSHGDTHISSGNVGHSVNVKSITNQVLRLNAAVRDNQQYDALLLGHVHTPLFMHLNETGTQLVINGTGSGTDPYAESIGYFRTRPSQVMWETTKEYPVGDFRIVDLSDADTNEEFEKIIQPYKYTLDINPLIGTKEPKKE